MIDYIAMMQEATDDFVLRQKYHGSRNDGFLTDAPKTIQLADDDYVRMRYDRKAMRLPVPTADRSDAVSTIED